MKRFKIMSLLMALTLVLTACGQSGNTSGDADGEIKEVVDLRAKDDAFLTVNGEEVSYSKYYKFFDLYSAIMSMGQNLNTELTNLFVLDKIVSDDLNANEITVTEEEVDAEVQKYISNLGSESEFNRYLSILGVTKEVFIQNIENSIKNQKHKQWYSDTMEISTEDKQAYYDSNKDSLDYVEARHILVEDADTAKEVYTKLQEGGDFVELANEYSIDEAANAEQGNLGQVTRARFAEEFVNAAFDLEVGQVSEPVETQFGFHIIEVSNKHIGLEANDEQISQALSSQKYNEYIEEKISSADVKLFDMNGEEISNQNQGNGGETPVETSSETVTETTVETEAETVAE